MSICHSRLGVVVLLLVSYTTPFYCLLLLLLNVNLCISLFWIFTFMMLSNWCWAKFSFELFLGTVCTVNTHGLYTFAKIIDQNKRHCHLDFFAYLHANVVDMQTKQPDAWCHHCCNGFFFLSLVFMYLRQRKQWWIKKNRHRANATRIVTKTSYHVWSHIIGNSIDFMYFLAHVL